LPPGLRTLAARKKDPASFQGLPLVLILARSARGRTAGPPRRGSIPQSAGPRLRACAAFGVGITLRHATPGRYTAVYPPPCPMIDCADAPSRAESPCFQRVDQRWTPPAPAFFRNSHKPRVFNPYHTVTSRSCPATPSCPRSTLQGVVCHTSTRRAAAHALKPLPCPQGTPDRFAQRAGFATPLADRWARIAEKTDEARRPIREPNHAQERLWKGDGTGARRSSPGKQGPNRRLKKRANVHQIAKCLGPHPHLISVLGRP
jgi:hypothetical protein